MNNKDEECGGAKVLIVEHKDGSIDSITRLCDNCSTLWSLITEQPIVSDTEQSHERVVITVLFLRIAALSFAHYCTIKKYITLIICF